MNISLRITPAAAEFIRKMLNDASEESVLVIAGVIRGTRKTFSGDEWKALAPGEILQMARTAVGNLPAKLFVDYYVGTKALGRVVSENVHVIEGIKCYLPEEMIAILGDREIVLNNGVLQFEPQLVPVEINRSK
jgi:hypothetical protein